MLIDELNRLGVVFESTWENNRNKYSFSKYAYEFLSNALLPPLDWEELQKYSLAQGNHSLFGDLNIYAFKNEEFVIEILVWDSSSPDIHSHSFSGAFRVVKGGSVHASYTVNDIQWSDQHLVLGRIENTDIKILKENDTHPIISGIKFLHGLYHWQSPSVTVVIRTIQDKESPHQFCVSKIAKSGQVIGTGNEVLNDKQLRAFRNLIQLRPWESVEKSLLDTLHEIPVWKVWHIYSENKDKFSSCAQKEILKILPEPIRRIPRTKPNNSILRKARPLLVTDNSRIVAGLILLSPNRATLINALENAFPQKDPNRWFQDALVEMFQLIFADLDADEIINTITINLLQNRKLNDISMKLRSQNLEEEFIKLEPKINALHSIISSEMKKFLMD